MIIKKHSKQNIQDDNVQPKNQKAVEIEKEEPIDLFDLDNIDFLQRQERRRGDRRRGYRRIDDRNLISRAQEEAQTIKEAAAKEGYKIGIEKAQNDLANFRNSIVLFLNAKQQVFDSVAPEILEISVDIARKILKNELSQNPDVVLETIMDVLRGVSKEESRINVKVNPQQVRLVKDNIPEMVSSLGLDAKISVIPEESIEPGNCILYSNNGIVDATVETQLEIIKEALKGI